MLDEGYIKYRCTWIKAVPVKGSFADLIAWRNKLYQLGLIGMYSNGIGYGNISKRIAGTDRFIISGTGTGHKANAGDQDFSMVTAFNFSKNSLKCEGPVKASSEALTHAMIYNVANEVNAVIHVHHEGLWNHLKGIVPTTGETIPYGTVEMANEVKLLLEKKNLKDNIVCMAGHKEGLITFGNTADDAGQVLMQYFNTYP